MTNAEKSRELADRIQYQLDNPVVDMRNDQANWRDAYVVVSLEDNTLTVWIPDNVSVIPGPAMIHFRSTVARAAVVYSQLKAAFPMSKIKLSID